MLVVGQGPIGLLLMQLCRWAGAEVIATDTMPDRLDDEPPAGGADAAIDATAATSSREVRALTEGRGADVRHPGRRRPGAFPAGR